MIPFKIKAFVPDLKVVLDTITIYDSGMLGMCSEEFENQLPDTCKFLDDTVFLKDEVEGLGDELLTVLLGDEWIWIEEKDFILLLFVGGHYGDKKEPEHEIYTGDVVKYGDYEGTIEFSVKDCSFILKSKNGIEINLTKDVQQKLKYVGNKYTNPELIK